MLAPAWTSPSTPRSWTGSRSSGARRRAVSRDRAPVLYVHGVPTSSDDWLPFLARTGGLAPDLLGFGRSGKGGQNDYSLEGIARFVERFLDEVVERRARAAGRARLGIGRARVRAAPSRADRAARRDRRRAAAAGLPLAPRRAAVAHAVRRRDGDRADDPPDAGAGAAAGVRRARPGGLRGGGDALLRPGHAAGDPAPVPQRAGAVCSPPPGEDSHPWRCRRW